MIAFSALITFCHITFLILVNIENTITSVPKCIINTINVSLIPYTSVVV